VRVYILFIGSFGRDSAHQYNIVCVRYDAFALYVCNCVYAIFSETHTHTHTHTPLGGLSSLVPDSVFLACE